jgi:hypothetical protein
MSEREFLLQMNFNFFKGQIIDVIPVSVDDNGISHEQDIVFKLDNGLIISISDNDFQCEKENIGQRKSIRIIISVLRESIEKCKNDSPHMGIFPYPLDQGTIANICGKIDKIIEPVEDKYKQFRRYAILDIGFGKICILIFKKEFESFPHFHEGDCIWIKGGGLTLLQLE